MAGNEIKNWATRFARDLGAGNTRILFERVLARHVQTISAIRATGLSWPSIASILAQEGVRRADGRLISSDHLRAAYSRVYAKEPREKHSARKTPAADTLRAGRSRHPGSSDSKQFEQPRLNPRASVSSKRHAKYTTPPTPNLAPEKQKRAGNLRAAMQRARNLRNNFSNE